MQKMGIAGRVYEGLILAHLDSHVSVQSGEQIWNRASFEDVTGQLGLDVVAHAARTLLLRAKTEKDLAKILQD